MDDNNYVDDEQLNEWFCGWKHRLGLGHWNLELRCAPTVAEYAHDYGCNPNDLASTQVHWEYMNGMIILNTQRFMEESDYEKEATIVHELVHVVLREMHALYREDLEDLSHEERVCTMLEKAFMRLRK